MRHREIDPLLKVGRHMCSLLDNKGRTKFSSFPIYGPINLLSDRLLRYILIFEYQILVLDLVVDIRTKISEGI